MVEQMNSAAFMFVISLLFFRISDERGIMTEVRGTKWVGMVCHLILENFIYFFESRIFTFTELQKQIQTGIKFTVHRGRSKSSS